MNPSLLSEVCEKFNKTNRTKYYISPSVHTDARSHFFLRALNPQTRYAQIIEVMSRKEVEQMTEEDLNVLLYRKLLDDVFSE